MTTSANALLNSGEIVRRTEIVLQQSSPAPLIAAVFSVQPTINQIAKIEAVDLAKHMQAGQRVCTLTVVVYPPMTAAAAETRNVANTKVVNLVAGAAGGAVSVANKFVGMGVGAVTRNYLLEEVRKFHEGDILISVSAEVNGGIGPQKAYRSVVVRRQTYDPNAAQP